MALVRRRRRARRIFEIGVFQPERIEQTLPIGCVQCIAGQLLDHEAEDDVACVAVVVALPRHEQAVRGAALVVQVKIENPGL